ncbi:MAG: amidohydrolase 3 [Rhodospirillaceae bacterium]|nr:MAG: amidohydrolase 3 [Rhodospirillaceae bacterium]
MISARVELTIMAQTASFTVIPPLLRLSWAFDYNQWKDAIAHVIQGQMGTLGHFRPVTPEARCPQVQGKDSVDAFLDTVLAHDLDTEFTISSWNTREDRMRELLNNPAILMALGDGGAHVDMLFDASYPTYLLGTWVREKQAITLEEGVRKLTSDPADLLGLKDRGRLRKGAPADVAIFDPSAIGFSNHGERRHDLPGGAKRIVVPSRGVEYTVVNGALTWEQGRLTDAKVGVVLWG